MEKKVDVDEVISLCARLALWLDDQLEPRNAETLAADLTELDQFVSDVKVAAIRWRRARAN